MATKKRAIPGSSADQKDINAAVKENIEIITGRRGEKIALLPTDAQIEDVISKINEIINRLQ